MFRNSLKLCCSTIVAATLLALLDADAQARKLEETCPDCYPVADVLRQGARYLHLGSWGDFRRTCLRSWVKWDPRPAADEDAGVEPAPIAVAPEPPPEPKPVATAPKPKPKPHRKRKPEAVDPSQLGPEPIAAAPTAQTSSHEEEAIVLQPGLQPAPKPPVAAPKPKPAPKPVAVAPKPEPEPEPEPKPEPEPEPIATAPAEPPAPPAGEEMVVLQPAPVVAQAPASGRQDSPLPPYVRCKVMLMGDSLMEDLGVIFYKQWKDCVGMNFVLAAKFSTGLTRPDYFNWPANLRNLMAKHRPDVLIVFLGGNDAMPIKVGKGKSVYVTQNGWIEAYCEKMREIRDIAAQNQCDVLWLGLPVFGSRYAKQLEIVAKAQEKGCAQLGIPFVNNYRVLADKDGNFQAFGPNINGNVVRLRQQDKEHMTKDGNLLLLEHSTPLFKNWLRQYCRMHPERCMSKEEAKKCRKPTIQYPYSS